MASETLVLRKQDHWFVIGVPPERDRRQAIILSLLEHAEQRSFDVELRDVDNLAKELGWTLDCRRGFLGAA